MSFADELKINLIVAYENMLKKQFDLTISTRWLLLPSSFTAFSWTTIPSIRSVMSVYFEIIGKNSLIRL